MAAPLDALLSVAAGAAVVAIAPARLLLSPGRMDAAFLATFWGLWGASLCLGGLAAALELPRFALSLAVVSLALTLPAALFLIHAVSRSLPAPWNRVLLGSVVLLAVVAALSTLAAPALLAGEAAPLFRLPLLVALIASVPITAASALVAADTAVRRQMMGRWHAFTLAAGYVAFHGAAFPPTQANPAAAVAWVVALGGACIIVGTFAVASRLRVSSALGAIAWAAAAPAAWVFAELALPGVMPATSTALFAVAGVSVALASAAQSRTLETTAALDAQEQELLARMRDIELLNRVLEDNARVLRASDERHRAMLESIEDGYFEMGLDGRVTHCNEFLARILRRPVRELLEARLEAFADKRNAERIRDAFRAVQVYDAPVKGLECELVRADGQRRRVELVASVARDGQGLLVGHRCFVRDVTERRDAEDERRRSDEARRELERLQELDKMKTQFINTAAHELRTPLTPIQLQLEMLRNGAKGPLVPDQQRSIEVVSRNVQRLGRLVGDLLDATRLQGGRLTLSEEPCELRALAAEAVASFEEAARRSGVRLDLKVVGSGPILADAQRVSQILYNLIDNALKFTPPGGVIEVVVGEEAGRAVARVRDTGMGIAAANIPKLFHPFVQVHDPAAVTRPGTGLGLFISRGIAEAHKGTLTCHSPGPGRGTTFTLVLPLAPRAQPPGVAAPLTGTLVPK